MSTTRRGVVTVSIENPEKLIVSFPYNLGLIEKVKSVQGYRWDKENKHWSFPTNTNGTLGKILETFEGEEIHIHRELVESIDPSLQANLSANVVASPENIGTKQSLHSFEDLRRKFGHANSKTT